ncbi:MAG: Probable DNA-binding protein, partial [uncultured Frankineae bacterium]
ERRRRRVGRVPRGRQHGAQGARGLARDRREQGGRSEERRRRGVDRPRERPAHRAGAAQPQGGADRRRRRPHAQGRRLRQAPHRSAPRQVRRRARARRLDGVAEELGARPPAL